MPLEVLDASRPHCIPEPMPVHVQRLPAALRTTRPVLAPRDRETRTTRIAAAATSLNGSNASILYALYPSLLTMVLDGRVSLEECGAGEGSRTLTSSLGSLRSTAELLPRRQHPREEYHRDRNRCNGPARASWRVATEAFAASPGQPSGAAWHKFDLAPTSDLRCVPMFPGLAFGWVSGAILSA